MKGNSDLNKNSPDRDAQIEKKKIIKSSCFFTKENLST